MEPHILQREVAVQPGGGTADGESVMSGKNRTWLLAAALAAGGCGAGELDLAGIIEARPLPLISEQALLTPEQVTCGEKKGLWTVDQIDGGGAIGRLTPAGQALGFGDDVRMGDRRFPNPYAQLRGDFQLKVKKVLAVTDENPDVKVVEVQAGVVVPHECFSSPLPLLGVEGGDFSPDAAPRIRLRQHDGWTADQVLH
jgi:hypothetical protein